MSSYLVEFTQRPIVGFQQSKSQMTLDPGGTVFSRSDLVMVIDIINQKLADSGMTLVSIDSVWELANKII